MEEQNNIIQEPKKKSPIGIIILLVILMIGCLVGGYFLNESGIFNKDKKDTEEKEKKDKEEKEPVVTNYEVTDEKVSNLIDNLLKGGIGLSCNALEKRFANDKKVEAKDISSEVIYHVVESNEYFNKAESFTLDEFNAAAKKYFDSSYNFDATSINYKGSSCPQFNYDSSTKVFTKQQTGCGGTCGDGASYKIVKAVDTDGTLVLDTKVIFVGYDESKATYAYYSDYAKTNSVGSFKDITDKYAILDKGSDYKFIFKLVDGNYVFVSSEPVK